MVLGRCVRRIITIVTTVDIYHQRHFSGPVTYRDFRETGHRSKNGYTFERPCRKSVPKNYIFWFEKGLGYGEVTHTLSLKTLRNNAPPPPSPPSPGSGVVAFEFCSFFFGTFFVLPYVSNKTVMFSTLKEVFPEPVFQPNFVVDNS